MSSACDQRCPFCSESERMARYARDPISYGSIVRILIRERRRGFDHVTFTGGEPTLHPRFADVLRAAKRLGYRTYVTSDGTRFSDERFARETLPLLDEICLSIHGDRPAVHDPLVGSPGSFERLMRAVRLIEKASPRPYLLTNTVITRPNLDRIAATVRFLAGLGPVRHCTVSNLAPDGDGLKNFAALAVSLREIGALAPALAETARRAGVTVRVFGVPLCVLGERFDLPNDLHWAPRVTVERGRVDGRVGLQEIYSPHPGRLRFYAPRCRGCAWREGCFGVFKSYYDRFGDGELEPRGEAA